MPRLKKFSKIFGEILLIILLISYLIFIPQNNAQESSYYLIVISDESDLTNIQKTFPGVRVHGTGTQNDPYVLENLSLTAFGKQGILINRFQRYLVLRNISVYCAPLEPYDKLMGLKGGIIIYDSSNIILEKVSLQGNWLGLSIDSSSNIVVKNSTITFNNVGIRVSSSTSIKIENSVFINNYKGLEVKDSKEVQIIKNYFINNYQDATSLSGVSNIQLNSNVFVNNFISTEIEASYNLIIENNTLIENSNGVLFRKNVDSVIVRNNIFYRNYAYAISILLQCSNITIYLNSFIYNMKTTDIYDQKLSQAQDLYAIGRWNTSEYGNYWADIVSISKDTDNDGILESVYPISGLDKTSFDWKPLAYPPVEANITKVKEDARGIYLKTCLSKSEYFPNINSSSSYFEIKLPEEIKESIERAKSFMETVRVASLLAAGGSIIALVIVFVSSRRFIKK